MLKAVYAAALGFGVTRWVILRQVLLDRERWEGGG